MFLTTEDKRMLDGTHGPGVQRAMDLLVKLGESFDSEKMTELSYVHSIYDVIFAAREKLEVNRSRKWGKPDKDGVIEHIETAEEPGMH